MAIEKLVRNCTKFLIEQLSNCSIQKQSAEVVLLESTCARVPFSHNAADYATLLKRESATLLENFKNTLFTEHLRTTASINHLMDCNRAVVTARSHVDYLPPTMRHILATQTTCAAKYKGLNILTFKHCWKKPLKKE